MNRRFRHSSRGVALITAMLIVALASIAAVAVTSRQQLDIRRSTNLLNGEQAYQFALGVEIWATQLLTRDRANSNIDTLDEAWAKQLPPLSVEGGQVAGRIEDLQGRYNLNNVVDNTGKATPDSVKPLQRMLAALDIPIELAWTVADWIDTDINASIQSGGAEDDLYTRLQPAYRTANTRMVSGSELLLINGLKPEYYVKLESYVCALPENTKINVNTASAAVLVTLSDNLSMSAAQALVEERDGRKSKSFTDSGADSFETALTSIAGLNATDVTNIKNSTGWDLGSSYFLVRADALFGKGRSQLFSELHRANAQTSVILRAQGVL